MRIRHIIAFKKKADFINGANGNLNLLSHVLPFAFAPGTGYFPYYYYRTSSDIELTQAMPYFILNSRDRLVLINRDFSKAALICDSDIIALYKESFSAMLEQSKPLIKRPKATTGFLEYIKETVGDQDAPAHWIEPAPCIIPLVTYDMLDQHLKRELPDREAFVALLYDHCGHFRDNPFLVVDICTTEGLRNFINTGYIYGFPQKFINPANRETIKELLVALKERIDQGKVKILFTNPSKITVPAGIHLSINRKTGVDFIMYENADMDGRAICLSEDSINEAFMDFSESMEESGLVYSESDSIATLDSIISEL